MRDTPVSAFLALSIIVVFIMYWTSLIKPVPCGNTASNVLKSHFIHTESSHIFSNLYSLYAISRVERKMKGKRFILLVLFIVTVSSLLEVIIHRVFPTLPSSIGFSGILFGLMTWELVTEKTIDVYLLSAIGLMLTLPSMGNRNVSFDGHAAGALAGGLAGLMYRAI
jgi:membrane associated rhomboid family serine protease